MPRLTRKIVEGLAPGERAWDDVQGFGARRHPSGRLAYVVRYRTPDGRARELTLGQHGVLTPEGARKLAIEKLAAAIAGRDPIAERDAARAARAEKAGALTLADVAEKWTAYQKARKRPLRPRTLAEYQRELDREILPRLGARPFAELVPADAQGLHDALADRRTLANRCLDLLSALWRWGEEQGLATGANPCRRVERFPEQRRERALTHDDLVRFGAALRAMESRGDARALAPCVPVIIRLLAFTGCRPGEIKGLAWADVDLDRMVLRLRDAKTGDRNVWLSTPALGVLGEWERGRKRESVYVFPARRDRRKDPAPVREFRKPWRALLAAAGIEHAEPYILRHTFASESEALGHSPYLTAALLGHSSGRRDMTRGYVHHIPDDVRRASERIGRRLAAALDGAEPSNVVPMRSTP